MEDNPEIFPQSNITYILNKVREGARGFKTGDDYAVRLIETLDPTGQGAVDLARLRTGLATIGVYLTDQEEHTMIRKFDPEHTGRISMEGIYNAL
jgi:Ca2+-binding EF-hand superfamily protein